MRKVTIYNLQDSGKQKVLATYLLIGNNMAFEGEPSFVNHLAKNGVLDKNNKTRLFPKDGDKFLDSLKTNFTSVYLTAVESK